VYTIEYYIINDIQKYVYVYEKNPMKKVYSSNAVLAIPINEEESPNKKIPKKSYVAEDKESYEYHINEIKKDLTSYLSSVEFIKLETTTRRPQHKILSTAIIDTVEAPTLV